MMTEVSLGSVKGHSAPASSSSRPFHFSENHALIQTICDRPGAVRWSQLNVDCLHKVVAPYNLQELFECVNFSSSSREQFAHDVKASANLKDGRHPIAWLSSLIPPEEYHNFTFTADVEIKSLADGLVTFQSSLSNRPDGVVLRTFRCHQSEWDLPLLVLEVHSSPYKNSVSQTAMDLIDQLRLLRCFDQNLVQCSGFTFPKYPQSSETNRSCVTKVTVSFEGFKFVVRLFPLKISEVKEKVKEAIDVAMQFHADNPQFCFLRLSESDLQELSGYLNVQNLHQFPTKHSILLRSDQVFWKHIPRSFESARVRELKFRILNTQHIVLPSEVLYYPIELLSFPAQLSPLSRNQVSTCLIDFMVRTGVALQELHGFGYAHLDVRIPNVCFSKEKTSNGKYDVKIIDLDRSSRVAAIDTSGYVGEMYDAPPDWTTDKVDWKQLGLLAARIITKYEMSDEKIMCSDCVLCDGCLRDLLKNGKWNEAACMSSQELQKHQKKSLDRVLDERELCGQ